MGVIPKNKRPEPTIESIEDYLYEYGQVSKDDKITIEGIEFEIIKFEKKNPKGIELHFEHPGAMRFINKFKQTIWRELKGNFDPFFPTTKGGYQALKFGYRSAGTESILSLNVEFTGEVVKGAVPAPIQEEGTTIILNRALVDNVKFDSKESILADKETNKQLKKLFGAKYDKRLPDWTWTYYQQNESWLREYGKSGWEPFVYGNKAFVKFFSDHMKNLRRGNDPKTPAGDYTTWNPSDIWAVKNMSKVKSEITKALTNNKPAHLMELNNILINLLEDEELVGISLKMVKQGQDAKVKLHNVETSSVLQNLKTFAKIEEYDMSDINFRYDNIWQGDSTYVQTNVKIGDKYEINIRKSGNRISFNTQIKGAAAQGGQTPVDMVVKMLKGKKFDKDQNRYPKTVEEMDNEGYEKMYNFITKGQGVKAPSYDEFKNYWDKVYSKSTKGKQIATIKLMQLSFWYDALTNYSSNTVKSAEFWTDMLYTGMKIKPGREFAPHAKIS